MIASQRNIKSTNHAGCAIKSSISRLYSQEPVIYRENSEDEDVAQIFVEIKNIHREFDFAKMFFTDEDRREFHDATHSWICSDGCWRPGQRLMR